MELRICFSKRLVVGFLEVGHIPRCGRAVGVPPWFPEYGLTPGKLGRVSLHRSREELRNPAPQLLIAPSLLKSLYSEIRHIALNQRILVLRLRSGEQSHWLFLLCENLLFIYLVNLLKDCAIRTPAGNELDTTPPLTKLMVQDFSQESRNLSRETLLFGITGLPGLGPGWLLHQWGSGIPASRCSVPSSTELLDVCQDKMRGPSEALINTA